MTTFEDQARKKIEMLDAAMKDPDCDPWRRAYMGYMKRIAMQHAEWLTEWSRKVHPGDVNRAIIHAGCVLIAEAVNNIRMNVPAAQDPVETWLWDYLRETVEFALEHETQLETIHVRKLDA